MWLGSLPGDGTSRKPMMHLGPSQTGGGADGARTLFLKRTLEVGVPRVFLPSPAAALPEPDSKEGISR